jgi:hypothetical protein
VGGFFARLFGNDRKVENYFHPYVSTRSRRYRLTVGFQPTVWYNDAGGVTIGIRALNDYLGRFEQNQFLLTKSGLGSDDDVEDTDFFFRIRNPVNLRAPNMSQTLDVFNTEGRYGAALTLEHSRRAHLTFGPTLSGSARLQWVAPDDFRYLDPGLYDDVGTVELQLGSGVTNKSGDTESSVRTTVAGGLNYNRDGLAASGRPDLDPFYFRGTIEGITHRQLLGGRFGVRVFAGVATGDHAAAKQRQIYLQGSDPLQQLNNPFLRSRGALLVGDDFRYHQPGGANVRGIDSRVSTTAIIGLGLELERNLRSRPEAHLFNRIALAAFTDLAQGIGGSAQPLTGEPIRFIADAGLGLRVDHKIGDTRFTTRFDLPLYVSRPELAQDREPGDEEVEFRWTFSFEEAF